LGEFFAALNDDVVLVLGGGSGGIVIGHGLSHEESYNYCLRHERLEQIGTKACSSSAGLVGLGWSVITMTL
jgi:hypothetical protein